MASELSRHHTSGGDAAKELARMVRQRLEMGGDPDLFLADLDREKVMELARKIRSGAVQASVRRDASTPGSPSPVPKKGKDEASKAAGKKVPERAEAAAIPKGTEKEPIAKDDCDPDPDLPSEYEALRQLALGCTRCALSESRTQVVFSDGNPQARLMVVGEAPGQNEDETGLPFVGVAGKFLDLLLASVGLSREDSVYICNVLKCRPPGNRNPQPDEIVCCSPYLRKQIELVKPEAILAVGTFAAQTLTGHSRPLGKLRGEVHSYEGVPLVVTYHPAALLRNSGWTAPTWDDLQLLRDILDGE